MANKTFIRTVTITRHVVEIVEATDVANAHVENNTGNRRRVDIGPATTEPTEDWREATALEKALMGTPISNTRSGSRENDYPIA